MRAPRNRGAPPGPGDSEPVRDWGRKGRLKPPAEDREELQAWRVRAGVDGAVALRSRAAVDWRQARQDAGNTDRFSGVQDGGTRVRLQAQGCSGCEEVSISDGILGPQLGQIWSPRAVRSRGLQEQGRGGLDRLRLGNYVHKGGLSGHCGAYGGQYRPAQTSSGALQYTRDLRGRTAGHRPWPCLVERAWNRVRFSHCRHVRS